MAEKTHVRGHKREIDSIYDYYAMLDRHRGESEWVEDGYYYYTIPKTKVLPRGHTMLLPVGISVGKIKLK